MTTIVRVLDRRAQASIDSGVWACDDPDVEALLNMVQVLDEPEITYAADKDLEIAARAVARLGGVIVKEDPPEQSATEGAEY